jgi:hypothetical protein
LRFCTARCHNLICPLLSPMPTLSNCAALYSTSRLSTEDLIVAAHLMICKADTCMPRKKVIRLVIEHIRCRCVDEAPIGVWRDPHVLVIPHSEPRKEKYEKTEQGLKSSIIRIQILRFSHFFNNGRRALGPKFVRLMKRPSQLWSYLIKLVKCVVTLW